MGLPEDKITCQILLSLCLFHSLLFFSGCLSDTAIFPHWPLQRASTDLAEVFGTKWKYLLHTIRSIFQERRADDQKQLFQGTFTLYDMPNLKSDWGSDLKMVQVWNRQVQMFLTPGDCASAPLHIHPAEDKLWWLWLEAQRGFRLHRGFQIWPWLSDKPSYWSPRLPQLFPELRGKK